MITPELCKKCGILPVTAVDFASEKLTRYCSVCIVKAIKQLPDPNCTYCLGNGEYLGHSPDCENDLCALAAAYDDCDAQMFVCGCSMLDGIDI